MLKRPLQLLHTNTRARSVLHGVNTSGPENSVFAGFPHTWQLITRRLKGLLGSGGERQGCINKYKHKNGRGRVYSSNTLEATITSVALQWTSTLSVGLGQ